MRGTITDIQRTSVVDGPGLRTTVFVKGCPLRCKWCHNPETQAHNIEPGVDVEKLTASDFETLGIDPGQQNTHTILERVKAKGFEQTIGKCSSGAIFAYGRETTVDEVVSEIVKDKDYYQNSGGGVTLSGGEPMSQPKFTLEIMRRSQALGIHTVLDTTGFMSEGNCRATLEVTDLYFFDYKASDEDLHQQLTGVSLFPILENLKLLDANNANILLRCPLIPGLNDDAQHMQAIARLPEQFPSIKSIDILTWHTMGQGKYRKLGRQTPHLPKENTPDRMKHQYRQFFENAGTPGVTVK